MADLVAVSVVAIVAVLLGLLTADHHAFDQVTVLQAVHLDKWWCSCLTHHGPILLNIFLLCYIILPIVLLCDLTFSCDTVNTTASFSISGN